MNTLYLKTIAYYDRNSFGVLITMSFKHLSIIQFKSIFWACNKKANQAIPLNAKAPVMCQSVFSTQIYFHPPHCISADFSQSPVPLYLLPSKHFDISFLHKKKKKECSYPFPSQVSQNQQATYFNSVGLTSNHFTIFFLIKLIKNMQLPAFGVMLENF